MGMLDGRTSVYDLEIKAALTGRAVRMYMMEEITPQAAGEVVLTGLAFNLTPGSVLFITEMEGYVESASDDCEFHLVRCAGQNGSGVRENIANHLHVFTGAALVPETGMIRNFHPPIAVRYQDGWRSVAVVADANAADTSINCGLAGFWETD